MAKKEVKNFWKNWTFNEEEEEFVDTNGNRIMVKKSIPHEKRESLATELAGLVIVTSDETGIPFISHESKLAFEYLLVKYCTDMTVPAKITGNVLTQIADYTEQSGLSKLWNESEKEEIWRMVYALFDAILGQAKAEKSVSYKFGKILDGMIGNEDLIGGMEKSNDTMRSLIEILTNYLFAKNAEKEAKKEMEGSPIWAKAGIRIDKKS